MNIKFTNCTHWRKLKFAKDVAYLKNVNSRFFETCCTSKIMCLFTDNDIIISVLAE